MSSFHAGSTSSTARSNVFPIFCVGTPGLGYPLLLCLGKSLVVILNYALTAE